MKMFSVTQIADVHPLFLEGQDNATSVALSHMHLSTRRVGANKSDWVVIEFEVGSHTHEHFKLIPDCK